MAKIWLVLEIRTHKSDTVGAYAHRADAVMVAHSLLEAKIASGLRAAQSRLGVDDIKIESHDFDGDLAGDTDIFATGAATEGLRVSGYAITGMELQTEPVRDEKWTWGD